MDTWFWILGRSLTIVTVTGNGFIIFLVCRTRRLRTKTNAFFVSLAVANFCVGLSAVPSLFVCEKTTGCDPEAPFADRVDYLRWLFTYASITNLCSLVLDSQFSHCCCEASQIVVVHDTQTCFSVDFPFLDTVNSSCLSLCATLTLSSYAAIMHNTSNQN